jgi:hypothetical protein
MKKFLILMIAAFAATTVFAQVPRNISIPPNAVKTLAPGMPETPCGNFAGTLQIGPGSPTAQSNDLTLDTIFLCLNDSVFIDHNGDFNLSGDPNPATQGGIGYVFYTCEPTVTGPTLQNIASSPAFPTGDPCRLTGTPPPTNGIFIAAEAPFNGDMWFFNTGTLQTNFNAGAPLLLRFAPITYDDILNNGYETPAPGVPPGPCVNANVSQAFEVVYLNGITATGTTTAFNGNDCMGRFRIEGGLSEWDGSNYELDIHLKSDPSIKALIYTPKSQINHFANIIFSVPQPGEYEIVATDGKSCDLVFDMDMGSCAITNSVGLNFNPPTQQVAPGETFCLPITTTNFTNITGFSFSLAWDPTVMTLVSSNPVQTVNPDLAGFDPVSNVNTALSADGIIGVSYAGGATVTLNSTETLISLCFQALNVDGVCTDINFTNDASLVSMDDDQGNSLAIDAGVGEVCVEFDPVQVTIVQLNPGCTNVVDLQLTITGGEGPYEVQWQEQPSGPTNSQDNIVGGTGSPFVIQDLSSGTYQITIIPENGIGIADGIDTIISIVSNPISASLDLTAFPTCNGLADGSVVANVFINGVLVNNPVANGYNFQWNPPAPNTNVLNNVGAGFYAVTVTQVASGCTGQASGQLGQPAPVDNGVVNITPASCTGVDDGSLVFNVEGGTPIGSGLYDIDVFFSQDAGVSPTGTPDFQVTGNPFTLNNTAFAGYYTLVIEDANGCAYTQEVEVPAQREVEISFVSATRPSCFGGSDGTASVEITVTPPTPGGDSFIFAWQPLTGGAVGTLNNQPLTSTANGLSAGTYLVGGVNANGCADTLTVEVTEPAPFVVVPISIINPNCTNPTAGVISVIGQGGTGTPNQFQYDWAAPLQNLSTGSANGLAEGTYTVTVTDGAGCTAVFDTLIALPLPPQIVSIDSTSVRCGGDGSLTVVAPTATSFQWSSPTGNVLTNPTLATISNLDGGTFIVVVTDANNCTNSDTINFASVDRLSISDTTITNPSCFGYADGSVAIGVEGGNPGYSYAWSTSAPPNSPIILNKTAGTYTVTVTDLEGCTTTGTFALVNPPQISILFTGVSPVSCFGDCNGAATPIVQYLPGTNFNFQWQDGTTDSIRTDLCAGNIAVTITEAGGNSCFLDTTILIASPPPVSADTMETIINAVQCFGEDNGSISVSAQGGNNAPYTFEWSAQGATGSTINNLVAGGYQVTITDLSGCTGVFQANVPQPQPIVVAKDASLSKDILCFGGDDGEIAVLTTGGNPPAAGNPPYTFSWSDGINVIGNTNPITDLSAGSYTIVATDALGCTGQATIDLLNPLPVSGNYQLGEPLECFGDETTLTINDITGGNGEPYSYSIDFGVPLDPAFPANIGGGPHVISYLDKFLCETIDSFIVAEPDPIQATFNEPDGINDGFIELQLGDSLTLTPLVTGAADFTFTWTPADFFINPTALQPTLYTFQSGKVTINIVDEKGCTGMGMLQIEIDPNRNVYVPNVFMPGNNLGTNDYFAPGLGIGVERVNYMRVYDRWGELLFSRNAIAPSVFQDSLTEGWDGRFNGKFVNPDVYVYAIEVLFLDGKVLLYRGDITVVR